MQPVRRARRGASVVVLTLLAGLALAGCRSQPGVAAYIGDRRITDDRVEQFADDVVGIFGGYGDARREVLARSLFIEVAKRYGAEHGLPTPQVDYAGTATRYNLPEDEDGVRLLAEAGAYLQQLQATMTMPAPLTEEQLHEVFDRAVAGGLATADQFEQYRANLASLTEVPLAFAVRTALAPVVERADITVDPRYTPLSFVLAGISNGEQAVTAVELPLAVASGPADAVITPEPVATAG